MTPLSFKHNNGHRWPLRDSRRGGVYGLYLKNALSASSMRTMGG